MPCPDGAPFVPACKKRLTGLIIVGRAKTALAKIELTIGVGRALLLKDKVVRDVSPTNDGVNDTIDVLELKNKVVKDVSPDNDEENDASNVLSCKSRTFNVVSPDSDAENETNLLLLKISCSIDTSPANDGKDVNRLVFKFKTFNNGKLSNEGRDAKELLEVVRLVALIGIVSNEVNPTPDTL